MFPIVPIKVICWDFICFQKVLVKIIYGDLICQKVPYQLNFYRELTCQWALCPKENLLLSNCDFVFSQKCQYQHHFLRLHVYKRIPVQFIYGDMICPKGSLSNSLMWFNLSKSVPHNEVCVRRDPITEQLWFVFFFFISANLSHLRRFHVNKRLPVQFIYDDLICPKGSESSLVTEIWFVQKGPPQSHS